MKLKISKRPQTSMFLYQSIHKLEQRIETLEMNVSNTQNWEAVDKSTMERIINDRSEFEKHFCPAHVLERLDDIPVWVYHETVHNLFKIIDFESANSPMYYTEHPDEMPLLIFGKLAANGDMRQPRFGITSDTQFTGPKLQSGLYIWISETAYENLGGTFFSQSCHTRAWRGRHVMLPELPLAIQQNSGWFLRK